MQFEWWYWVVLGIVLLITEALTPGGFYLLFIGVAGIITGLISPLINTLWLEVTLFAVMSALFIVLLRKPLVESVKTQTPQADSPEFIGETGKAIGDIPAGKVGTIELRGSTWKARNAGVSDIASEEFCIIIKRDGLQLVVEQKNTKE